MKGLFGICAILFVVIAISQAYPHPEDIEDVEDVEERQAQLMEQGFFDSQLAEEDEEHQQEVMGLADMPDSLAEDSEEGGSGGKRKGKKGGRGKGKKRTTTESP